jgi:hypothetical protein
MNRWGYSRCIEKIDTIVDWLHEEATKRGWKIVKLPLSRYAIRRFILKAIKE